MEDWFSLPALVCVIVMTPIALRNHDLCAGLSAQECGPQAKTVLQEAPALVLLATVVYIWFMVDTLTRWLKSDKLAARNGRKMASPMEQQDRAGVSDYVAKKSEGYATVRADFLTELLADRERHRRRLRQDVSFKKELVAVLSQVVRCQDTCRQLGVRRVH